MWCVWVQLGNQNDNGDRALSIKLLVMTRQEMQTQLNNDYLFGKISVEEWSEKFDELSNVRLWVKDGKVKEPKEEKKNG